jgi:acyl-CoA hydrolase
LDLNLVIELREDLMLGLLSKGLVVYSRIVGPRTVELVEADRVEYNCKTNPRGIVSLSVFMTSQIVLKGN